GGGGGGGGAGVGGGPARLRGPRGAAPREQGGGGLVGGRRGRGRARRGGQGPGIRRRAVVGVVPARLDGRAVRLAARAHGDRIEHVARRETGLGHRLLLPLAAAASVHPSHRVNTSAVFWPPTPNELELAARIGRL